MTKYEPKLKTIRLALAGKGTRTVAWVAGCWGLHPEVYRAGQRVVAGTQWVVTHTSTGMRAYRGCKRDATAVHRRLVRDLPRVSAKAAAHPLNPVAPYLNKLREEKPGWWL